MAYPEPEPMSQGKKLVTIIVIAMAGLGIVLAFAPAHSLLIVVGMAPTLAAWLASQREDHALRLPTILAFNLTGVLPFAIKLWRAGKGFDNLIEMLVRIDTWLIMYGAAGLGLLVIWLAPQVAAYTLQLRAVERKRSIERQQRRLAEEWGAEFAPAADEESIKLGEPLGKGGGNRGILG